MTAMAVVPLAVNLAILAMEVLEPQMIVTAVEIKEVNPVNPVNLEVNMVVLMTRMAVETKVDNKVDNAAEVTAVDMALAQQAHQLALLPLSKNSQSLPQQPL